MQNAANNFSLQAGSGTGNRSLPVLVDALEQLVRESEDDFLELGMNLQKVQMMSSAQRQKIAATMSLFKSGENDGILQQITSYVQSSQQETQNAQQTASGLCTDLAEMIRLMDSIAQKTQALERAGLFLHVIGINTGIECARHDRMEATFKVVSQDTILLAEQIRSTTETLLDQTTLARAEQDKTMLGARKSIESLQALARESKEATDTALGKVAELIDYSISMVNEVERMSHNITSEINRVVMGIQFHDNLRQRIEHVNEVLLETGGLQENPSEEDACNAYLSIVLQKAQLDTLVVELEDLYQTQSQAVANILEAISHLEARLESMASERANESSRENPVAILLDGIGALEHLNTESLTLGREIRSSSERAEQIARDMHNAVQGTFVIANNVKINALNAIIKAAKFGRIGESLQVLAQGMVDVSKDTRDLILVFDQMLQQLGELVRNEDSATNGAVPPSPGNEFDINQVEQVFQGFRDEVLTSRNDCHNLAQSLEREEQHLAFITKLKDTIQQQSSLLGRYAETIRPQNEELLATMRNSFGKQLETRYTMNEEREIHQRIHQLENPSTVTQQVVGGADDCLFFDDSAAQPAPMEPELWGESPSDQETVSVELFSESSPDPGPAATDDVELWGTPQNADDCEAEKVEQPPVAADVETVELWDEPAAAGPEDNNEPNKEKEEFGDNVELF